MVINCSLRNLELQFERCGTECGEFLAEAKHINCWAPSKQIGALVASRERLRVECTSRYVPYGDQWPGPARETRCCRRAFFYLMKFILARKERMTQIFTDDGRALAGTVLRATPSTVTQVKTIEGKDKYAALQVGFGARKASRHTKAVQGHLKGKGFMHVQEFRTDAAAEVGSEIKVDTFAPGDAVQVSGISKGKGFQGGVKRHGFHGGSRTHGQKHSEREVGSIGGSGGRAGGRVAKGLRMPGRMGGDRVTVKNLRVLAVDTEAQEIIISGAIPGARGTVVEIVGQ
jgi:large subunit ribosomal protein L3